MQPLAIAAYTAIAGAATLAALVGILAGAIAAAVRGSLIWVALLAAAGYLAQMVLVESTRLAAAALIGLPPLLLTLLVCWLTANLLETRKKWGRRRAIPAAMVCALVGGVLDLLLFRLAVWAPSAFALAADAVLLVSAFLARARRNYGFDC